MTEQNELRTIALRLYDLGFNIIPINKDEQPLTKWDPKERIPREELEKLLERPETTGVAIVAGPKNRLEKAGFQLLLVDVDDPDILNKMPYLKNLIKHTVRWYTGPRCPKCGSKHVEVIEEGKRFRCSACGTEFTIENAKRGLVALFYLLPGAQKYFNNTIRAEKIELIVDDYRAIPPSLPRTGVRYEWDKQLDQGALTLGVRVLGEADAKAILRGLDKASGNGKSGAIGDAKGQDRDAKEHTDSMPSSNNNQLRRSWTKWFIDNGFVVIPLLKGDKRPAIEWAEYADPGRKLTDAERQRFLQLVENGFNFGVLGGHNNLVILDFEDYDLAEKWILTDELKKLCEATLCVKTPHGGLHVYAIADELPPQKFNPAFVRDGKVVMDLQSVRSYVVGPGSCINHKNCDSSKCPWKGQDITTCYEPLMSLESVKITKFNLRGLLSELARRGEALGIMASPSLLNWLKEDEGKSKGVTEDKGEEKGKKDETKAESRGGKKAVGEGELRKLQDSDIILIKDLLKEAYEPGVRQNLVLYLSGWLAKARIHPLDAVQIVKSLHDETGDEDSLKMRLGAVVYTYKKAGIDIDKWGDEIEKLTGVKPYGLEKQINEGEIKGKSGLQELLVEVFFEKLKKLRNGVLGEQDINKLKELAEQKALTIIKILEDILGTPSPYRDSIIGILNVEKQFYAVSNLKDLTMARARMVKGMLVYGDIVAIVAPTKVVIYTNPIEGITKYQITFEGKSLKEPLVFGPALMDEIIERLKVEGRLVRNKRLLEDILNAIVGEYELKGLVEYRSEIDKPGFYIIKNKIIAVNYDYNNVDMDKLKQALELLNELATVWFKHVQDRFAFVIKWGAIAPFNYIIKEKSRFLSWLYLFGDSATGKTTLGRIVLKMWGLDSRYEKSGANIDSMPRLGYVISQGTFPVLINEPGGALSKDEIVEAIKNAIDSKIVRGKYIIKGTYIEIPALAPLIFASNKSLPKDDALLRRFYIVSFTFAEKIPVERQKEFKEKVEHRLSLLSEIGKCITKTVFENPQYLDIEPIEAGKQLVAECYKKAGIQPPEWLNMTYENDDEDIYDKRIIGSIRSFLLKRVNEEYVRFVGRVAVEIPKENGEAVYDYKTRDEIDFEDRVMTVLRKKLLPWAILRNDNVVVITTEIVDELEGSIGTLKGLKSIAELLGWEYGNVKINGEVRKCAKVKLDDFLRFLNPEVE